jgi:hypothetical protein
MESPASDYKASDALKSRKGSNYFLVSSRLFDSF